MINIETVNQYQSPSNGAPGIRPNSTGQVPLPPKNGYIGNLVLIV